MGDEEQIRARIEAQVASRRAAAASPNSSHSSRSGHRNERDDASDQPLSDIEHGELPDEAVSGEKASRDAGAPDKPLSRRERRRAKRDLATSDAADGQASGPAADEPPVAPPLTVTMDEAVSVPRPGLVLQEHWTRERETLIAQRAALHAEHETLVAQRAALAGLRESSPAVNADADQPAVRKRGWRRWQAGKVIRDSTAGASQVRPRHAAVPGQHGPRESEPVSPFESLRAPQVPGSPAPIESIADNSADAAVEQIAEPVLDPPAPDSDLTEGRVAAASSDAASGPDEAGGNAGTRAGWSRRTLDWLFAPAERPEDMHAADAAQDHPDPMLDAPPPAPGHDVGRARAPEPLGLPPWRLLPDIEPVAAPPPVKAEPQPEPVAGDAEPADEPDVAAGGAAVDANEAPQRRRGIPAFVPTSGGPRSADIARERETQASRSSPVVTATAFTSRSSPPAAIDDDEPEPDAAKRRRLTARGVIRLFVVIVIAAVVAVLVRTYVAAPYYIPSASMEPTLHGCTGCNNDHVLVDKLSYKIHDIRRGDVVVFHRPKNWPVSEKVLIKRVIGLPGDTLTARNGIVYVNGLVLDEPYLNRACQGGTTNFPPNPVTVLDGQAFVMGDNRCDSSDSRLFGAVTDSAVIGRAFMIIWPLGHLHWL